MGQRTVKEVKELLAKLPEDMVVETGIADGTTWVMAFRLSAAKVRAMYPQRKRGRV
jgi:hypothetical protein